MDSSTSVHKMLKCAYGDCLVEFVLIQMWWPAHNTGLMPKQALNCPMCGRTSLLDVQSMEFKLTKKSDAPEGVGVLQRKEWKGADKLQQG
jgi:hypothetical protein